MIWIKGERNLSGAWAVAIFAGVTLFAWPLEMPFPDDYEIVSIEEWIA